MSMQMLPSSDHHICPVWGTIHRWQSVGAITSNVKHVITEQIMQRVSIIMLCECGEQDHVWLYKEPRDLHPPTEAEQVKKELLKGRLDQHND